MRTPLRALVAVLCGISLLTSACDPIVDDATTGTVDKTQAASQLNGLKVATWHSMAGYSRDRFPHWRSQGQDCDTRDVVLQRAGTDVSMAADCKIERGRWTSVYDGKTFTEPGGIDIDHVVPLAAAWRTGADKWTDAQRGDFANDLDRPQLIAVSASSNRSKGDQDPSQWKPPNQAHWCAYANNWIAVKAYWKLFITTAEKGALVDMLKTC